MVARPDRALVRVFEGRVRRYRIGRGPRAHTIRFDLHGGFCGRAGAEACSKTRRITARPFAFKEPAR
jgi:hypothetical protein